MKDFFIRRPIFSIVTSIVIVLVGVISILSLPVEQYPDITPPVVQVTALYPGADALSVDQAVATPIAQDVIGTNDMLYMQSTSDNSGQMRLLVTFEVGSDPDMDAVFTQNNVAAASAMLPPAVTQQGVVTKKVMTGFLVVFSLWSDGRYDGNYLANYAYINIQNELQKINGVGQVQVMGAGQYSMRVWVRPDRLDYHGISIAEIAAAIESQSGVLPAGKLGGDPSPKGTEFTYTVTMPPQITTEAQYADIIIKTLPDGEQVRLGDVATVELGSQTYGVSSSFDDRTAVVISVYQTPGSNAMDVCNRVKATMEELSARFTDGIGYTTVVDTTASIKAGIRDIFVTLLIALLLVVVIIYLFIQDLRATLIPLVAIPVSLVGAFVLFPLLGFSLNIISLLGLVLAIGLVVDDAIVVVEAVQVNIERGMKPAEATIEAMKAVSSPIIATTVALCAVFIPVSLVGGITGKLYQQFSVTIAFSVVISAFNALTLSPALCAMLLRPKKKAKKGFFARFNRAFGRGVEDYLGFTKTVSRHGVRTLILIAVVGAALWGMFTILPRGFLPSEDQGYLIVSVDLPDAASMERTREQLAAPRRVSARRDEVEHVSATAGYDILSTTASTSHGLMFITLKDYADRKKSSSVIAAELNRTLYGAVPGARAFVFGPQPIPGLGIGAGLSLMLQDRGGHDLSYLSSHTRRFIDTLGRIPEIGSASTQFNDGVPQRTLVINRDYATQEGVDMSTLNSLLATFLGGTYINNFNRFGKLYQTYIQAEASYRQDARSLDSYFVRNASGESVPLSAFVEIVDTTGVEYITSLNLYRAIDITAAPAARYSSAQAMDAIERVAAATLPDDVTVAWKGISYQERTASSQGSTVYLLAVVFVFLALAALYNSWTLPLAVLLGVPFAIFGAMAVVYIAHLVNPAYINNLFMQISLVMLMGLASKNAILIVEYASRLYFEQGLSLLDAAIGAAKLRVRPIIMTAFAFILGVSPLIFASGAYSSARNIMGLALLGGMLVATLLGIFVYPALFVLAGRVSHFDRKRQKEKPQ